MHITKRFFLASSLVLSLFAVACGGGEPDVDAIAGNLCTCSEAADGAQWDTAMRTACVTQISGYLQQQSDECLSCLDDKVGDSTAQSACAAADGCTACRDDGE